MPTGLKEQSHQRELSLYHILDALPEEAFDRIARLAAQHYRTPIALISLGDRDRRKLTACLGLDAHQADRFLGARSFDGADLLVVPDAARDARFAADDLTVGDAHVRFYAAAPVTTLQGDVLGMLCIADTEPRPFGEDEAAFLRELAVIAAQALELHASTTWRMYERAMLESVTDAIVGVDAAFDVSYLNEAACRLYDVTPGHVGRPLAELFRAAFPCDDDERTYREAIRERRAWSGEVHHHLPSGRTLLVSLLLNPLVDATGERVGILAFIRDITRQRAEEERLKLLESVTVNANDAVLITPARPIDAPNGPEIIYANDAFCRMTGYTLEEVIGRTPRFLQGPKTDREQLGKIRHALETWTTVTVELVNYRKDGSEFVVEFSVVPAGNKDGWYTHWISIQRDVTERRRQEERLRLLESVVVHASDAIIISEAEPVDAPGPRVLYVNDAYTRMTGYEPHEIIGQSPRIMQGEGTDRATLDRIRANLKAWRPVNETVLNYTKEGRPFWVSLAITPVANEAGWYTHWVSVQRDVTKEKRQLELERDRRAVLELVTAGAPLPQVLTATLQLLEHQLEGMTASILLRQDDHLYEGVRSALPLEYREAVNGFLIGPGMGTCGGAAFERRTIVTADILTDERWIRHRHLALRHGLRACWSTPILSKNHTVLGTFGVYAYEPRAPTADELALLEDKARLVAVILERYQALDDMQRLALYDPLTGLANRTLFHEQLRNALALRDPAVFVGVGLLDVDRFKLVNDTLGHGAGDELLCMIARRLAHNLSRRASIARMGGDEFTLLLEHVTSEGELEQLAQRALDVFRAPFLVSGQELFVQGSLGFALHPKDASEPQDLLRLADVAMYHAKRKHLGWALYTPDIKTPNTRAIQLEAALNRALERHELTLHYQPLVHAHEEDPCAVEALLRWNSPEFGNVSPAEFIPIAEDSGLIVPIGEWVLRQACRDGAELRRHWPDLKIAVNLSFKQFSHANLVSVTHEILQGTTLPPDALTLEITESVVMEYDEVMPKIEALRALGVSLAIDDFGVGYSSLSYLKRLPVQAVKLDRSFIVNAHVDPEGVDAHLVRAMALLARGMKIGLVAEGVETRAQAAFLRAAGVQSLQGWLYSRAVAFEDLLDVLTRLRPRATLGPDLRA
ncbi:EAL domain-containing protein [Deinococcus yavapaiensis]|uniref:PAS domain S-box-containing protein/diguanylate cyclase (GGDEF)-like protein n=1 Tax=Deinococcus yavapaiensis KR-236 TaxID=694435 RepID=A0A318SI83_9DEIO|nr:EAL domain-containing protein [Deinococcus yavapaiensis]PYE53767.1 PAS domain S-box-containing protein/diguanylate cyclase (GGDEF)-like protein [Deinococcus yavapaiensis KR-236]